ncbi:MAG TPA: hypothetical protein VMW62_00490 [Chloroflexota bacterium]|nr:hypothetical protein [Chloroflexota bacterium]
MSSREGRRPRRRGRLGRLITLATLGLVGLAVASEMSRPEDQRPWHGRMLGVPYDFRPPTSSRLAAAFWNSDAGLLTPTAWGLGWSLNFGRLLRMATGAAPTWASSSVRSALAPVVPAIVRQPVDPVTRASMDSFPASDAPAR